MEQIKKLVVQQMSNLQNSWQANSEVIPHLTNEISIYKGELTTKCILRNADLIKKAFPSLPIGFYDVFTDMLKLSGFTDSRLTDATTHVICTCIYPTPTIANFISFDRRFKVYHYEDMLKLSDEMGAEIWNSYGVIMFPDREKNVWVHVDDIKRYNLKT